MFSKTATVGDALDALPAGRAHWWLVAHISCVRFAVAFADQLSPFLWPGLADEWGMESDQLGVLATASSIGNCVGTALSSLLDGSAGRTVAMRWGSAVACSALLLQGLWAPNFPSFLCLQAFQQGGMFLAEAAWMVWLQEHLPTTGRGSFYACAVLGWPFGKQTMIYVASLLHAAHWRLLLLCAATLLALVTVSAVFVDDSPRQLAVSGHPERALAVLQRMYATNATPLALQSLRVEPVPAASMTLRGRLRRLCCTRTLRTYTLYAAGLFSTLGVTTRVLDTWGPSTFQRLLFPGEPELPYAVLLRFNLGDTMGVVASIFLVELVGRRGTLALGFFGQATFLSLLVFLSRSPAVSTNALLVPIGMVAASFRVFRASAGLDLCGLSQTPCPRLYCLCMLVLTPERSSSVTSADWDGASLWVLEAFPTELRASALAVSKVCMQVVASVALSLPMARHAMSTFEPQVLLLTFCATLAVLGTAVVTMLPLETRGLPMI
jgi:putative MFS transporter